MLRTRGNGLQALQIVYFLLTIIANVCPLTVPTMHIQMYMHFLLVCTQQRPVCIGKGRQQHMYCIAGNFRWCSMIWRNTSCPYSIFTVYTKYTKISTMQNFPLYSMSKLQGAWDVVLYRVTSSISFIIRATLRQQTIGIMKLKTNCEGFL